MGHIKKLLPHIHSFRNRHGTMVHYFRRRGCKIVRLRGIPGSPEFMRAYEAARRDRRPDVRLGRVRRSRRWNAARAA